MFITIEGGEGAGKSSLLKSLQKKLKKDGHDILVTREPGGTRLGEEIRRVLLNADYPVDKLAELMLFLSSRVQHIEEVIKPALDEGKVVLCDRFNDSSIAYQGGGRQLGVEMVAKLCYSVCKDFRPHFTLLLDLPPEEGIKRLKSAGLDRIETEDAAFHERVREGFLALATREPERFAVIDAQQTPEKILEEAYDAIQQRAPLPH